MVKSYSRIHFAPCLSTLIALVACRASLTMALEEPSSLLEEVVVTAQARAQTVQDVPIAIDAVTGDAISERVMLDIDAFAAELPSLTISESPFQKIVNIRGVGSSGGNRLYEQSVPFFIDGIFGGRAGQFIMPFFDIERVEVVKGPQSIFFGKNASAGAIAIYSNKPTQDFSASVKGGYESEHGGHIVESYVSGPLGNTIRGRLSVRTAERGGFLENLSSNDDEPEIIDKALRGTLSWDFIQDWNALVKAEASDRESSGTNNQLYCANRSFTHLEDPFGNTVECIEDTRNSSGALAGPFAKLLPPNALGSNHEIGNALIKVSGLVGNHTLESVSAWSRYDINDSLDVESSSLGFGAGFTDVDFDQLTQEFRLLSPADQRIEYVIGIFFLEQQHDIIQTVSQIAPPNTAGASPPPDLLLPLFPVIDLATDPYLGDYLDITQDQTAYSAFAQFDLHITDNLNLQVGARYTKDDKGYDTVATRYEGEPATRLSVDNPRPGEPSGVANYKLSRSETSLDPAVNLQWFPRGVDMMLYASYGKGTKSGGFEGFPRSVAEFPLNLSRLEYEKEEATNYEVGFKSTLFDRSVRINAAVFRSLYRGLQLQYVNAEIFAFETTNADKSVIDGAEFEGRWAIGRRLSVGGAFTYIDARFTELSDPRDGSDLSGNRLPLAPRWSGNAFAETRFDLFQGKQEVSLRAQANYTDERYFDFLNIEQDSDDAYTTVDLRAGVGASNGRWEFSVNLRNAFDEEDIRVFGNPQAVTMLYPNQNPRLVILAPGRTIHTSLQFSF